ncbi:hypothetical protein [Conexibacter woesei]|uniref:Uncharacterized protein n=1 Tax=Conexibacter woesei (strain DSM 14684 / CCUG 47730 / CIP 108061 / JCM 11494 / NBRC 100937 / ID131577) TaxID=469383 RepID=D3F3B3_CONWI|nr:hypothetical protein [Conexibacter woesei]ADB50393.1 hypothetical protein Cwoe_1967 [Conexibacter woesei DSM 14684]
MSDSDDQLQRAVLDRLLDIGQLSIEELIRDLTAETGEFAESDPIERAVRELVRAGLAHRHGPFAMPTRAAVRFSELGDG